MNHTVEIIEVVEESAHVRQQAEEERRRAEYERRARSVQVKIGLSQLHELFDVPPGYEITSLRVDELMGWLVLRLQGDRLRKVPNGQYLPTIQSFVIREELPASTTARRVSFIITDELLDPEVQPKPAALPPAEKEPS